MMLDSTPEQQAAYEQKFVDAFGNWRRRHAVVSGACKFCVAPEDCLATHCAGSATGEEADAMVKEGLLDFIGGQWISDPLLILSMRAMKDRQQN